MWDDLADEELAKKMTDFAAKMKMVMKNIPSKAYAMDGRGE